MKNPAFLLFPILLACGDAPSGDGTLVRFAPGAGTDWRQWTVTEQSVTQELSGVSSTVTQSIGVGTRYRVVAVAMDGVVTMQATWDSIAYRQSFGGGDVYWSSADTSGDIPDMAIGYAAMAGQWFSFRLRSDGTILGIEGGEALRRRISDALAERGEPGGFVDRSLMATFTDSALIASLTDVFSFYPAERVDPNDTWSRDGRIVSVASLDVDSRFSMTGRADGLLTVAMEGTIRTNDNDPPIEIGDLILRYDMKGAVKGELEIDEKSGWMMRGKRRQTLEGTIRSFVGKERKEGVDIPISITGTVTTTTTPLAARMSADQ